MVERLWWASPLGLYIMRGHHRPPFQDWLRSWLFYLLGLGDNGDSFRIFSAILWSIWLHRNEIIFKGGNPNCLRTLELTHDHIKRGATFVSNNAKEKISSQHYSPLIWWRGRQLNEGSLTLVVDGAWKRKKETGSIRAAFAWILFKEGTEVAREASDCLAASPLQTELIAILQGLRSAGMHGNEVLVKTDCNELVKMLINSRGPIMEEPVMLDILSESENFRALTIKKVGREEVQLAHLLASTARRGFHAPIT